MTYLRRTRKPTAAPKRPKQSRVGKATGTIRLDAPDMSKMRTEVYHRARGRCEDCGVYAPWKSGELAHTKSRGAGGSDAAENCRWLCAGCHFLSHAYGPTRKKPNPPKLEQEVTH